MPSVVRNHTAQQPYNHGTHEKRFTTPFQPNRQGAEALPRHGRMWAAGATLSRHRLGGSQSLAATSRPLARSLPAANAQHRPICSSAVAPSRVLFRSWPRGLAASTLIHPRRLPSRLAHALLGPASRIRTLRRGTRRPHWIPQPQTSNIKPQTSNLYCPEARRTPKSLSRPAGQLLLRPAERQLPAGSHQQPPRRTRPSPEPGPGGSVTEPEE